MGAGTKEDFLDRMRKDTSGSDCWVWLDKVNNDGCPIYYDGYSVNPAIRTAYSLFVKEINSRETFKPMCLNSLCVNPDHFKRLLR